MDAEDCLPRPLRQAMPARSVRLSDNLTGVFEKRNQDVVSPATKWNDLVRLPERALGDIELEWAKAKPDRTG